MNFYDAACKRLCHKTVLHTSFSWFPKRVKYVADVKPFYLCEDSILSSLKCKWIHSNLTQYYLAFSALVV